MGTAGTARGRVLLRFEKRKRALFLFNRELRTIGPVQGPDILEEIITRLFLTEISSLLMVLFHSSSFSSLSIERVVVTHYRLMRVSMFIFRVINRRLIIATPLDYTILTRFSGYFSPPPSLFILISILLLWFFRANFYQQDIYPTRVEIEKKGI